MPGSPKHAASAKIEFGELPGGNGFAVLVHRAPPITAIGAGREKKPTWKNIPSRKFLHAGLLVDKPPQWAVVRLVIRLSLTS
jgi:hypothetical protein